MLTRAVHNAGRFWVLIAALLVAALWIMTNSTGVPRFKTATIKPCKPGVSGLSGFYAYPGGRIFVGEVTLKTLVHYAFNVEASQISGGPPWIGTDYYNVEALPPAISRSTSRRSSGARAAPNAEERKMLQSLVVEKFGLKFHRATKEGSVYILTRGNKGLEMKNAKDKDRDPRAVIFMQRGGVVDGAAAGVNVSMPFLAKRLAFYLDHPVVDQTGLEGSYDFRIPPSDLSNRDMTVAVFDAVAHLGLQLRSGTGTVEDIVIISAHQPMADK